MLLRSAVPRASPSRDETRRGPGSARKRAPAAAFPREVRSVLSELWHAEPGYGPSLLEVRLSSEGRGRAEVQGDDADDESASARRVAGRRRASSSGRGGAASAGCVVSAGRAAASGGAAGAEQAQGDDGRRGPSDGGS